jgi:hypothetical protein
MSRILQEKFEVRYPQSQNGQSGWTTDASARRSKGGYRTRSTAGIYEGVGKALNDLPPGMDIDSQNLADIPSQPMSMGNLGNGDQVTTDVTEESLRMGYDRKKLLATDDAYTREHNDSFYDEPVVDGETGFIERNNMLDRM